MKNNSWADTAYEVVKKVATAKEEFTPDDIWEAGLEKPIEARALGAVMRRAKQEGLIEKTGRVQPTTQQESHGTDVTIWRSNIYNL
ncbi:hypothetical protein [Mangrovibacter phragmitis]|uniref:hypothetical protein n=1 Tax=Mangrovibacter phragmitis TaxID=1691903 RepID=UPI003513C665